MKRRDFIVVAGGAASLAPLAAHTQPQAMPEIGVLGSTSSGGWAKFVAAFHQGLGETGFVEGTNVAFAYRWADNQVDRLPALAADLVGRQVAVLVPMGGSIAARAAKAATATIPVVFAFGGDPVKLGVVASLNRPGGNATGVSFLLNALVAKRLEMMRELVPTAGKIGLLVNPKNPSAEFDVRDVQGAARILGLELLVANASGESDFAPAFTSFSAQGVAALLVLPDPVFISQRASIVALADRHALPAIYALRDDVEAGGLMSYGPSISDAYRQQGVYVGRILKGQKPADLPIIQSIKIETAINLKTARALGLTVPRAILARADELIE
jgi:putative ABC transport system substrate-binding protein